MNKPTDPYRLYFQLPEERVDLSRLKMVCLQLSDGTELWFEKQGVATALLKKLADTRLQAEHVLTMLDKAEQKYKDCKRELDKEHIYGVEQNIRARKAESRVTELENKLLNLQPYIHHHKCCSAIHSYGKCTCGLEKYK